MMVSTRGAPNKGLNGRRPVVVREERVALRCCESRLTRLGSAMRADSATEPVRSDVRLRLRLGIEQLDVRLERLLDVAGHALPTRLLFRLLGAAGDVDGNPD